jgi:putative drug exporter of the RND superfamily
MPEAAQRRPTFEPDGINHHVGGSLMFNAIGGVVTRRPWFVIAAWIVAAIAVSMIGGAKLYDVTTEDTSSFLPSSYESVKGIEFGQEHFGHIKGAGTVTGLVRRSDHGALTPADQQAVTALVAAFPAWRPNLDKLSSRQKDVRALAPRVLGVAGGDELVSLQFRGNSADPKTMDAFKQFRSKAIAAFHEHGLQLGLTGGIASQTDVTDVTKKRTDMGKNLLLLAIVLLTALFFRGVLSTLLPLFLTLFVANAAVGLVVLSASGFHYHLDSSVPELIQVVLLGIGIDYYLFMVFRFRERLRLGESRKEAARQTAATVSKVVASAALAIVVAFASLGLARFGQFRVIGPSVAISVAVMMLAGITLIPAMMAATGKWLFWPSKSWKKTHEHGPASRLGALIARRPARVAVVTAGGLTALALAGGAVKMSYDFGSPPKNAKSEQVQAQINTLLPRGVTDEQQIYVSSPHPLTAASLQPMRARLASVRYVGQVSQPAIVDGGHAGEIDVALTIESATSKALALAGAGGPLRTAAHESVPPGATAMVAGQASALADVSSSVNQDLRKIFPIAAALILLILFLMLRSAVAPVYLLLAVGLEFAATLGATVLLFQDAMHRGGVIFTLPLLLFLFVVAIGTDYNILMSARLREETDRGATPKQATARAVGAVAPAIAAAGLVLAASFSTLMLAKDLNSREIGFAMAIGIIIASFIVSTLLVPAVTTMLGAKAWWPHGRSHPAVARPREVDVDTPIHEAA